MGFLPALDTIRQFFTKKDGTTATIPANKVGEISQPKNRIADELFVEFRSKLETDIPARERVDKMMPRVIALLEPFYSSGDDLARLHNVPSRTMVAIEPARRAFEHVLRIDEVAPNLDCYYNGQYDYVMMRAEMTSEEELEEVLLEEVMHYMKPLPEDMLINFDKKNGLSGNGFFQYFNEGATLYYIRQLLGRDTHVTLQHGMLGISSEGLKRDMGSRLWQRWIAKYGEQEMKDMYFGRREPSWLIKKLENWDWWKIAGEVAGSDG